MNFQQQLEEICSEAITRLRSDGKRILYLTKISLSEGLTHPTDINQFLKIYEELIEIKTYLKLYNQLFPIVSNCFQMFPILKRLKKE